MAYMNQEQKAKIAAALKPILKKYGIKGTLSVRNHSTICLTLKSGKIDFCKNSNRVGDNRWRGTTHKFHPNTLGYDTVNPYWFQDHYDGVAKDFLTEAYAALKSAGWYDNTDASIDYFDTAYYTSINIGLWNKPYVVAA